MADAPLPPELAPIPTPATEGPSAAPYRHPRISGGDGSTLNTAVVLEVTAPDMALVLIQLHLEQIHGVKDRDWTTVAEHCVDSANHPPRSVRFIQLRLASGTLCSCHFILQQCGGAAPPPRPRATGAGTVLARTGLPGYTSPTRHGPARRLAMLILATAAMVAVYFWLTSGADKGRPGQAPAQTTPQGTPASTPASEMIP